MRILIVHPGPLAQLFRRGRMGGLVGGSRAARLRGPLVQSR